MTTEQLLPIITEWFGAQKDSKYPLDGYADCSDPGESVLDGHFNLEDLARTIAAASADEPPAD